MSDTVKLIIEIPKEAYNVLLTEQVLPSHIDVEWLLIHGIPLDDVKAEIDSAKVPKNRMSFFRDGIDCALQILDNIGKADMRGKA